MGVNEFFLPCLVPLCHGLRRIQPYHLQQCVQLAPRPEVSAPVTLQGCTGPHRPPQKYCGAWRRAVSIARIGLCWCPGTRRRAGSRSGPGIFPIPLDAPRTAAPSRPADRRSRARWPRAAASGNARSSAPPPRRGTYGRVSHTPRRRLARSWRARCRRGSSVAGSSSRPG